MQNVYVTGSNSKFLSSDLVTEFRGRGDEIRIYPLSFREYCSVYEGSADEAWDDYFTYGGLPLILSRETTEEKAEYLMSLFQKVYLSDIIDRHKVRHQEELDELVDILASAVGSLTESLEAGERLQKRQEKDHQRQDAEKVYGLSYGRLLGEQGGPLRYQRKKVYRFSGQSSTLRTWGCAMRD